MGFVEEVARKDKLLFKNRVKFIYFFKYQGNAVLPKDSRIFFIFYAFFVGRAWPSRSFNRKSKEGEPTKFEVAYKINWEMG